MTHLRCNIHRAMSCWTGLVALVLALVPLPPLSDTVLAQDPGYEVRWSEPINLSDTPTSSAFPSVIGDPYGKVHVFWSEDILGQPYSGDTAPWGGKAIFHREWDGQAWTAATDVLSSMNEDWTYPTPAADGEGMLHLVWASPSGIRYSVAHAAEASKPMAWSAPVLLSEGGSVNEPALVADSAGSLNLLYSELSSDSEQASQYHIYYRKSVNGGGEWSRPVRLSGFPDPGEGRFANTGPRLAIDGVGRIHAVWYESRPPNWTGEVVYYAVSADGGKTWSAPRQVYAKGADEVWTAIPEVAALGTDEIHVTWASGDMAYRSHQWSRDGGQTWTAPERQFAPLLSMAGRDAMTTDSAGHLYWVMQLRYPEALWCTYWNGSRWTPPTSFITDPNSLATGHAPSLAVSNGNELNLVFVTQRGADIWYSRGLTPAGRVAPLPAPTQRAQAAASATPTGRPVLDEPEATVVRPRVTRAPTASPAIPLPVHPVTFGVILVVLIIGATALVRTRRKW